MSLGNWEGGGCVGAEGPSGRAPESISRETCLSSCWDRYLGPQGIGCTNTNAPKGAARKPKPSSRDEGFYFGWRRIARKASRGRGMLNGVIGLKRFFAGLITAAALAGVVALAGCGNSGAAPSGTAATSGDASAASTSAAVAPAAGASANALAPGEYTAEFTTDSSMFHVNESQDGKGVLLVEPDGKMTIHVSLVSKRIDNLYLGKAADAEKDEANWLQPTLDKVKYKDGYEEEVYGFDIPVPAIGEQFDVALIGDKGKWYDHKVSVSNPEPLA